MRSKFILFQLLFSLFVSSAWAHTYYVNANGDDAATGTSVGAAWRTIARVNAERYYPGDRILFAGGQNFTGGIWLRSNSQGTATHPIVISSYGKGSATIESGTSFGFYGHNMAGIELRRLVFVGSGRLSNKSSGVILFIDSVNTHLNYLRLDSLDVSGYQSTGILVNSWKGTSGYSDVRITNCDAHANGEAGIASFSEELRAHSKWYVGNCRAYDNSGRADVTTTHTGNGIVLSGIDGALVEHCKAYNNGWLNANRSGGPVGIWGWCCNNLVIQECESHHNRSGTSHDGGGFDLDGGCTNSVLQYNYSHDNDGPGYLLAQYPGAPPLTDLIVRYNISENDARRYNQGAILLWSSGANGGIQRASIYNNTVYLTPPADGSQPKAVHVSSGGISAITLQNNVLHTTGGVAVVRVEASGAYGVKFQGNCYWSASEELCIDWAGTRYTTLDAWRAATGQEQIGGRLCGFNIDPQLVETTSVNPSSPQSPNNMMASGYKLKSSSSLLGAGLDLLSEFGQAPGPRDFFGDPTPKPGLKGNVGASENKYLILASRSTSGSNSDPWCAAYPTLTSEKVYVQVKQSLGVNMPVMLQLYDQQGRVCRTQTSPYSVSAIALSVAGLPAGRYLLQVQNGKLQSTQPIIITN